MKKTLKTNVGPLDRGLRIAAGSLLILLFAAGIIGPWGMVGIVPLATGLLGFCPLYTLLGVRTCADPERLS